MFCELCSVGVCVCVYSRLKPEVECISVGCCPKVTSLRSGLQVLSSGTHSLGGKNIDPKRAKPRGPEPVKKVFVGGLDPNTSEDEIRDYFGQYGTVNGISLLQISSNLLFSYNNSFNVSPPPHLEMSSRSSKKQVAKSDLLRQLPTC